MDYEQAIADARRRRAATGKVTSLSAIDKALRNLGDNLNERRLHDPWYRENVQRDIANIRANLTTDEGDDSRNRKAQDGLLSGFLAGLICAASLIAALFGLEEWVRFTLSLSKMGWYDGVVFSIFLAPFIIIGFSALGLISALKDEGQ